MNAPIENDAAAGSGGGGGMHGPAIEVRVSDSVDAFVAPQERVTVSPGSTATSEPPFAAKCPMDASPPPKKLALLGRHEGQVIAPTRETWRSLYAAALPAIPRQRSISPAKVLVASVRLPDPPEPRRTKPTHPGPTPAGAVTTMAVSDHEVTVAWAQEPARVEKYTSTSRGWDGPNPDPWIVTIVPSQPADGDRAAMPVA